MPFCDNKRRNAKHVSHETSKPYDSNNREDGNGNR